jgi:hypothetical protein
MSPLSKTWILDLDGTLVVHNGYKNGEDELLPGVKAFLERIPADDYILIVTSREHEVRERTEGFLKQEGIRYDRILFEMPMGERILINDDKPSGLPCAYAVRRRRNQGMEDLRLEIDDSL